MIREEGTSRRNHPNIAVRRRRRHPRPLIIAEQRMSRKANERHEHRSPARSNHSARLAIIIDTRSSHARGRGNKPEARR